MAGGVSPGNYTITIQGTSNINQTTSFLLTVTAAQQTLNSASITPSNGTEVQLTVTATDPLGASHISLLELNLSDSTSVNHFPSQMACRFTIRRSPSGFVIDLRVKDAASTSTFDTRPVGSSVSMNNNACGISMGQTTVTQNGNNLTASVHIVNSGMAGTFYLWGLTQTDVGGSLQQALSYLGPYWNVPVAPSATFSNSQQTSPPSVYPGYSVNVTMTGTNLGSNFMVFRLVQAVDGTVSTSGTNPIVLTYTAGNNGQDRDIMLLGLICNTNPCDANNAVQSYPYTVRALSSSSSPPSLNFTNPFTQDNKNPSLINGTITADGTTSTQINFAIDNTQYSATQCSYYPTYYCTPIQHFYLNINKTFTESSLAQDRSGGCRLHVTVNPGSSPSYGMYLMSDDGSGESGVFWTPTNSGGSVLSNSQCSINVNSGAGAYAYAPYATPQILGLGLPYTFQASFVGKRYVFMMGNRSNGDWTGWQYRGTILFQ